MIMGVSGIYATIDQLSSVQSSKNWVAIELRTFKLNSANEEIAYEETNKFGAPSEIVSFIPKIENSGGESYIRAKIFYINENIDAGAYITGMTDKWEKHGEYYYYKDVVDTNETVKLFNTIQIPQNVRELTSNSTITLEITAEAIQNENFEPDYTEEDPWKGIVPEKNTGIIYYINDGTQKDTTKKNPKTGDTIDVYVITFVLSAIGLIVIIIIYSNENKKQSY